MAAFPSSDYAVSLSMSMSTSVSSCGVQGKYVYDRQFVLDICNKNFCYEKYWLGAKSAEHAWSAMPNGSKGVHSLVWSCTREEILKAVR